MDVFENMIFPRSEIVGAIPPPPGVKPNFLHPESREHTMIAVNVACLTIGISFVLMRLWTRSFITRSIGWDDLLKYGGGKHMWEIPRSVFKAEFQSFLSWSLIAYTFYIPSMGAIKISILLLYLRLFSAGFKTRYTIYGLLLFVASYTLAFELSLLFGCKPVAKLFNRSLAGKCINTRDHVVAQQIFNIVSDVFLFILPIPIAWRLHLPLKQKLGVICVFTAGSMSCIASVVRMTTITIKSTGDVTWGQFDGIMWGVIELNFALICSCMPAFKPFLEHAMPFLRNFSSRIHSSQRSATSSNIKNDSSHHNTTLTSTTSTSSSQQQREGRLTFHECKAEFVQLQHHQKGGVGGGGGDDGDATAAEKAIEHGGVSVVREVEIVIDEDERVVVSQV
ncbi:MAG: hypothetical protein M1816_000911 [Peltula sp. TS41687]|nr:MAG: hypothetical protein M1816_000911 [Peltula sp. TS41687]